MFGSIGIPEITIILFITLLIFGPRQLPKIGRGIGESIREFRNVGKEITSGMEEGKDALRDVERELDRRV